MYDVELSHVLSKHTHKKTSYFPDLENPHPNLFLFFVIVFGSAPDKYSFIKYVTTSKTISIKLRNS